MGELGGNGAIDDVVETGDPDISGNGGNGGNGNGGNGNGNGGNGNGNGGNGNGGNGNGGNGNGGNGNGGNGEDMMKPEPGPHALALSDRIVLHAATPAQLVKSGDGLQYYFIGADGSTVSGPNFPVLQRVGRNASLRGLGFAAECNQPAYRQASLCRLYFQRNEDSGLHLLPGQRGTIPTSRTSSTSAPIYSINVEAW